MPNFDWQFLVVTMLAAGAGGVIVRRLMPARKVKAKGADAPAMPAPAACAHCAFAEPASAATRPAPARTATVPVVSVHDLRDSAHQRRN
jgi:hypothetical protein